VMARMPDPISEPSQVIASRGGAGESSAGEGRTGWDSTGEEGSPGEDDGFFQRRSEILAAGKGRRETAGVQQKGADVVPVRSRMTPTGPETSQASAQQASPGSQSGSPLSLAGGSDAVQSAMANSTGGGHSGGQSGGQNGSQQSAQQMMDGGLARGASDRTLLHRLNTDNAGWSETMVKRLTADLRSGVQNVRIILEPHQLGRLNVELGLRDGRASIRIAAETQEAARLLSGARGQLGQMLEGAGMRLASFQATGSQTDAGLDTGQGAQGRGGEGAGEGAGRNNTGRDQEFANKMDTALDDAADDAASGDDAPRAGETAVLSILA